MSTKYFHTWQPLGPLLKVKLLVGYMRSCLCRVGTVNSRRQSVLEPQNKDKHETFGIAFKLWRKLNKTNQPTTSNRRNQGTAAVWPSIEVTNMEVRMYVELSRDGALRDWEFNFIFVWKILVAVHINEFLFG